MKKTFITAILAILLTLTAACGPSNAANSEQLDTNPSQTTPTQSAGKTPFTLYATGAVAEYVTTLTDGEVYRERRTVKALDLKDEMNFVVTHLNERIGENGEVLPLYTVENTSVVENGCVEMMEQVSWASSMLEGFGFGDGVAYSDIEGNLPLLLPDPKVGEATEFAFSQKITIMGFVITVKMSGTMTVAARESMTVRAGTFDCFRIDTSLKIDKIEVPAFLGPVPDELGEFRASAKEWVTAGIGPVKTEGYDGEGNLSSTEELISIRR